MKKAVVRRREFLKVAAWGSAACIVGVPLMGLAAEKMSQNQREKVSPVEDLMREHGALNRILLIYDEVVRRIGSREEIDYLLVQKTATINQSFIENYHAKLEEEHVFPRLKQRRRLVGLVDALLAQHRAGRLLTESVLNLSRRNPGNAADRMELETAITKFIRMYRPHEAREDTVIFPEFKRLLTPKEYDLLGDEFEKKERQLFGNEGFEAILAQIAGIERSLGIYDLAKFTPS